MAEVCALALVAALSFFILSELRWRGAPVLLILCFVGVLSVAGGYLKELGGAVPYLAQSSGMNEGASAILKVVGVGYLAGISSDICSELGAARIGNAVTLVGRLEIIAIATPFFVKILDMGVELIG